MSMGNLTPPISSCMYSTVSWAQRNGWTEYSDEQQDNFYTDQITAPFQEQSDIEKRNNKARDGEKNRKNSRSYKHVPHKDKPAQVVARRNARERRRVQAVNTAFTRLRRAVPIENTRGKRISKVKTLQYAIEYIYNLQKLLDNDWNYESQHSHYCFNYKDEFVEHFNDQF